MIFNTNKTVQLETGDENLSVRELWSRWLDWYLTGDNSKYGIWMFNVGGDDIDTSEGTSIPIYLFLESAGMIKPKNANYTQKVSDGILLVAGGGDPFSSAVGSYTVRINYQQPVQAITVSTAGGGGLTTEQDEKLMSLKNPTMLVGGKIII